MSGIGSHMQGGIQNGSCLLPCFRQPQEIHIRLHFRTSLVLSPVHNGGRYSAVTPCNYTVKAECTYSGPMSSPALGAFAQRKILH